MSLTAPSVTAAMPCPASCTLGITPWTGQWSTNSLATPYATRSVVVSAGSTTTSLDCKHDVFSRLYLAPTAAPSNAIYSLDDNCNLVASVSDGPGASAVVATQGSPVLGIPGRYEWSGQLSTEGVCSTVDNGQPAATTFATPQGYSGGDMSDLLQHMPGEAPLSCRPNIKSTRCVTLEVPPCITTTVTVPNALSPKFPNSTIVGSTTPVRVPYVPVYATPSSTWTPSSAPSKINSGTTSTSKTSSVQSLYHTYPSSEKTIISTTSNVPKYTHSKPTSTTSLSPTLYKSARSSSSPTKSRTSSALGSTPTAYSKSALSKQSTTIITASPTVLKLSTSSRFSSSAMRTTLPSKSIPPKYTTSIPRKSTSRAHSTSSVVYSSMLKSSSFRTSEKMSPTIKYTQSTHTLSTVRTSSSSSKLTGSTPSLKTVITPYRISYPPSIRPRTTSYRPTPQSPSPRYGNATLRIPITIHVTSTDFVIPMVPVPTSETISPPQAAELTVAPEPPTESARVTVSPAELTVAINAPSQGQAGQNAPAPNNPVAQPVPGNQGGQNAPQNPTTGNNVPVINLPPLAPPGSSETARFTASPAELTAVAQPPSQGTSGQNAPAPSPPSQGQGGQNLPAPNLPPANNNPRPNNVPVINLPPLGPPPSTEVTASPAELTEAAQPPAQGQGGQNAPAPNPPTANNNPAPNNGPVINLPPLGPPPSTGVAASPAQLTEAAQPPAQGQGGQNAPAPNRPPANNNPSPNNGPAINLPQFGPPPVQGQTGQNAPAPNNPSPNTGPVINLPPLGAPSPPPGQGGQNAPAPNPPPAANPGPGSGPGPNTQPVINLPQIAPPPNVAPPPSQGGQQPPQTNPNTQGPGPASGPPVSGNSQGPVSGTGGQGNPGSSGQNGQLGSPPNTGPPAPNPIPQGQGSGPGSQGSAPINNQQGNSPAPVPGSGNAIPQALVPIIAGQPLFPAPASNGLPPGAQIIGTQTVVPGGPAITVTPNNNGGQPAEISIAPSAPFAPIVGGQTLSSAPQGSGFVVGTQTLAPGGSALTLPSGGAVLSLGTSPPANPTAPTVVAGQTVSPAPSNAPPGAIIVGGQTLSPGGPPITLAPSQANLAPTTLSLINIPGSNPGSQPTPAVVQAANGVTSTVPLGYSVPNANTSPTVVAGQTLTPAPSGNGVVVAGQTLSPGGSPITISPFPGAPETTLSLTSVAGTPGSAPTPAVVQVANGVTSTVAIGGSSAVAGVSAYATPTASVTAPGRMSATGSGRAVYTGAAAKGGVKRDGIIGLGVAYVVSVLLGLF